MKDKIIEKEQEICKKVLCAEVDHFELAQLFQQLKELKDARSKNQG